MAKKVVAETYDDFDGSPAVETVRFAYAGRSYEIDLNEQHAAELDDFLATYIEHARPVSGEGTRARRNGSKRADLKQVRDWARGQGFKVAERGRIPADIIEKYDAQQGSF